MSNRNSNRNSDSWKASRSTEYGEGGRIMREAERLEAEAAREARQAEDEQLDLNRSLLNDRGSTSTTKSTNNKSVNGGRNTAMAKRSSGTHQKPSPSRRRSLDSASSRESSSAGPPADPDPYKPYRFLLPAEPPTFARLVRIEGSFRRRGDKGFKL